MIRIDAAWLATQPLDMRAGTDTALARVVAVFGAAHPHTAYLAARRLHQGKFIWPSENTANCRLGREQLDALVLGLPWARMGEAGIITIT